MKKVPYVIFKSTAPGCGNAVGDIIFVDGERKRITGMKGWWHPKGYSPPVFISEGNVDGLYLRGKAQGRVVHHVPCGEHYPPCMLFIRYADIQSARSPTS